MTGQPPGQPPEETTAGRHGETEILETTPITDASRSLRRWLRVLTVAVCLLIVGAVGYGALSYGDKQAQDRSNGRISALEDENSLANQKIEALAAQVIAEGQVPVATPSSPGTSEPPISQQQANLAYRQYCMDFPTRCVGPAGLPGRNGRDGRNLTAADALLAVQRYCATGACRATVTPQDIANAVQTSCNSGRVDCKGDQGSVGPSGDEGKPGPKGDRGEPGTGLETATCTPQGFVFHLSDGTDTAPVGDCQPTDGQDGQPGVVAVQTDPSCNGPVLTNVHLVYDAPSQTITLVCTPP